MTRNGWHTPAETKVSYAADPIKVSYADPVKVSYEADPINSAMPTIKVSYGISKQAWKNLAKTLSAAHHCPDPQETASAILRGWINGYGPTFASVEEQSVVDRIQGLAAGIGLREIVPGILSSISNLPVFSGVPLEGAIGIRVMIWFLP